MIKGSSLTKLSRKLGLAWKPPPKWTISQWGDGKRILSSEASAESGKWRTSRAEYQREMMDAVSDPRNESVVFKTSSQIGKTEVILNVTGYYIDIDPAPILVLQPTQKPMAEDFARDRLNPMIRDTPAIRTKVKGSSKDKGNSDTLLHKSFPGGHVTIAGAGSPSALASRPIRVLLCDEVDRYPKSAGKEGDPVDLAGMRTKNFPNRKKVYVSTPTIKYFSRIDVLYESGDQRKAHIPCPRCGEFHELVWDNVVYSQEEPEKARFKCPHCEDTFSDVERLKALPKVKWVSTAPFKGIASFHISALYSPWTPLAEVVTEYLARKDDPERYKTWMNTFLGLSYDDEGLSVDEHVLAKRAEDWGEHLPDQVLRLTAGVDVQPDRLELELVGWGMGDESWSIEYKVIYGDPEIPEGHEDSPWTALVDYWRTPKVDRWGFEMRIHTMGIDSGGANTTAVYEFCKKHKAHRLFAFKGRGGEHVPVVSSPMRKKTGKKRRGVDLFTIGVDQAKATIYRRLKKAEFGPGYCHFPKGRELEYYEQLTAEKAISRSVNGFAQRVWEKKDGVRNEALDCRVYAYAAMVLSAPLWSRLRERSVERRKSADPIFELVVDETIVAAAKLVKVLQEAKLIKKPAEEPPRDKSSKAVAAPKRHNRQLKPKQRKGKRRGGFVNGWRQ